MGTDFFSSNYGPGVIGTILAAIVFGGFALLYFLVFDARFQGGGVKIEVQIEEQQKEIERLQARLTSATVEVATYDQREKLIRTLETTKVKAESLGRRLGSLIERRDAVAAELRGTMESFSTYKADYRESARKSLIGKEYERIETLTGVVFENVEVTDVDPLRMQIRHKHGGKGIALTDLPQDIQDYLQLDAEEAEAARHVEVAANIQGDEMVRDSQRQTKIARLQKDRSEAVAKRDKARDLVSRAQQAEFSLPTAIQTKRMQINSEKSGGGISNAPQLRQQLKELEGKLAEARRVSRTMPDEIAKLDEEIAGIDARIEALQKNSSDDSDE